MSNTSQSLSVQKALDDSPISRYQWKIILLCFLIVATDGLDTAAIGFIAPAIIADWGLSKPQLTPLFISGLIGLTLGAIIFGPLADRLGRKKILIFSVFFFGLMSLLSAFSPNMETLAFLRFLTGIGLGGAMPTAITLTSEFLPARRRSALVTLMFCGFTLGSALGGVLTAQLLHLVNWHGILVLGGVLPLALVIMLSIFLDESPRYRVSKNEPAQNIAAFMGKITGKTYPNTVFHLDEIKTGKSAVTALFQPGLFMVTAVLWLAFFMSFLIIYLFSSWVPTLLGSIGVELSKASWITAAFQIGGTLGAIYLGNLMDKRNPYKVLITSYILGAGFIALIGFSTSNIPLLVLGIFGAGVGISGAQVGFNSLSAILYPTECRATGVSWANAAGRCGAIFGAFAGGTMISWGYEFTTIFKALAFPALITASCILVLYMFSLAKQKRARQGTTMNATPANAS